MQLLNGSRQSGKTTALLEYCNGKEVIVVCYNQNACNIVKQKATKDGYVLRYEPITITHYMNLIKNSEVFIDAKGKASWDRSGKRFKGEFVCEELQTCLEFLGLNFKIATSTIPVTHPQNYIAYKRSTRQNLAPKKDILHKIIGEFDYE